MTKHAYLNYNETVLGRHCNGTNSVYENKNQAKDTGKKGRLPLFVTNRTMFLGNTKESSGNK
jgi:hypothetical protein